MGNQYTNQIEYMPFTQEEQIIHHLMLNASSFKRNGLFYGTLGIVIAFFECGRYRNNPVYIDYAIELQNSLPKKLDDKMSRDFAAGLCGFGWGIEYMIQKQFIDSKNIIDTCSAVDEKIMMIDIRRMNDLSLETGMEGLLHYVMIRLAGTKTRNEPRPFDNTYLNDIRRKLQFLPNKMISSGLRKVRQLFFCFVHIDMPFYKPDIYLFTNELELKSEDDILAAKLGLADGLAGILIRTVYPLIE